jgi:Ca2+-binding EF-hand superfamily protein
MRTILFLFSALFLALTSAAPVDDGIGRYVDDIFFHYDTNEDKVLDRQEARQFFKDATESQRIDDAEYTEWFRLIDANRDGRLSWQEVYNLAASAAE